MTNLAFVQCGFVTINIGIYHLVHVLSRYGSGKGCHHIQLETGMAKFVPGGGRKKMLVNVNINVLADDAGVTLEDAIDMKAVAVAFP